MKQIKMEPMFQTEEVTTTTQISGRDIFNYLSEAISDVNNYGIKATHVQNTL